VGNVTKAGCLLLALGLGLAVAPSLAAAGALDLAAELFDEGQWAAARAESERVLMASPAAVEADRARLLAAVATLRLPPGDHEPARGVLDALWISGTTAMEIRCRAAYELALARLDVDARQACEALVFAYLNTREVGLFWQSGCALYFHLLDHRAMRRKNIQVWRTLQTCSSVWPADLVQAHRGREQARHPSWGSLPIRGLVALYRAQIAPAIGSRCELHPSCSAYALEAGRAHGLPGVAMMADRFIREPAVSGARQNPVVLPGGRIKYADPLSDHDFWMKEQR
jgi:putative component of membrane protein insertase Oxa1/YidC/SpoIIIJ protein YidD